MLICGKASFDRAALNNWWRKRSIPASRDGLKDALEELHISSSEVLLQKCYGLSLSDQYWINPDNTSDGWLKKKWSIIDGKRMLFKAGSNIYRQEPYNEAIAGAVMKRLGIPHTDYHITMIKEEPYSVCENFITKDTELVTANHLMEISRQSNNVSNYQHFVNCCREVGLDAVPFLDRMLTVDFIIANVDRHTNNFGLVRNAETLQYIGFAPIYDSGSSLWFNALDEQIQPFSPKIKSKPFKTFHYEQIKLVTSFDWLDLKALDGSDKEAADILSGSEFINPARRTKLCNAIKERIGLLSDIISRRDITASMVARASTENDIEADAAYCGVENNKDFD